MNHVAPQTIRAMRAEADRLLDFGRRSWTDRGFGWLDDSGALISRPLELWINCRMTHVAALGLLSGRSEFAEMADHGVASLLDHFQDTEHGGWYAAIDDSSGAASDSDKLAYAHAFVLLAASSAVAARRPRADELLDLARQVHDQRFWIGDKNLVHERFSADWVEAEPYLGVNAAMHTVEAFLAVHDVTGEQSYLDRAEATTQQVLSWARERDWRIPEHFDLDAIPLPDYNRDSPADPFRPFGATVGHALEWSRLALSVRAARRATDASYDGGLVGAATQLADRAVTDGWAVDGADGFVYTTDWSGEPVVHARMHWVVCEAIGAAYALGIATGEQRWDDAVETWWDYADRYLIDRENGSWHHELDARNAPASDTWVGKPDVYHAFQACLLVGDHLPLAPSFATALARR
ncbi:AGE family epimerase/isomerase [Flexivirga sp. ID2601S]|uniref:AGE family epimerase/isomerase n=1 Tax=Flexivirga aerilata TaxID=1656889 RepID=A0A849AFW0_9MICO|nr:AGE family epimerase/isomerase [Flexivirga aerilata]NNG38767.1 AGE family epimerase/isomerase [Flexivirga aerilata]